MTDYRSKGRSVDPFVLLGVLLIAAALILAVGNLREQQLAGNAADSVIEQLSISQYDTTHAAFGGEALSESDSLDRISIDSETPMPSLSVDGNLYLGVLRIPSLGLELPVMRKWSYDNLRIAPCCYSGSIYAKDMVIAAHNYDSHFGTLKNLNYGAEVSFVDIRGNVFVYEVASIETLSADAVREVTQSEWDLTLFTCTFSGAERVTVRCREVLL